MVDAKSVDEVLADITHEELGEFLRRRPHLRRKVLNELAMEDPASLIASGRASCLRPLGSPRLPQVKASGR